MGKRYTAPPPETIRCPGCQGSGVQRHFQELASGPAEVDKLGSVAKAIIDTGKCRYCNGTGKIPKATAHLVRWPSNELADAAAEDRERMARGEEPL